MSCNKRLNESAIVIILVIHVIFETFYQLNWIILLLHEVNTT